MTDSPNMKINRSKQNIFDVVIIGGGPAGLSAAIYSARANLYTIVLDKNPTSGALGLASKIDNFPGVPRAIEGLKLLSILRGQAEKNGAKILQKQVIGVDFSKVPKEVMTADEVYQCKTAIIATGSMGRKPTINGEDKLVGRGVSYCAACDAPFYREKGVAVIGGNEEALEELDSIAKFAGKIYFITHSGKLTTKQAEILHMNPKVEVIQGRHVVQVLGKTKVDGLLLADSSGNKARINVSGVFIYLFGNQPIVDFLYGQLDVSEEGCIMVNKDMATSKEGVFAAGDVTCKKIRQAIVSAAEGCTAALSAEKYINKRQRARLLWE